MTKTNKTEKLAKIQSIIDNKTKPVGALGKLEDIALQLALIQSDNEVVNKIEIKKPVAIVFAGDHGIAKHGVSIAPSEVTTQMVANFIAGGAAINCFCRANDIELKVVDCGILNELPTADGFVHQRLGKITNDLSESAAMSHEQVAMGLELGRQTVRDQIESGSNFLMFGEMGIGNTSSAAALLAASSNISIEQCVGRGTGINDQQLQTKRALIEMALKRVAGTQLNPKEVLAEFGGFEIVQMVGAFLEASRLNTPVLVDGFIVTVSAYIATLIEPKVNEVLIYSHCSDESAHRQLLGLLNANPILDMNLRLGEGSGAALAYPLVRAAMAFYNDMASFESAGVTV
jgi:nicotinate-nucleotide--dimethylbenzimidazole phosphoribosyltransferase